MLKGIEIFSSLRAGGGLESLEEADWECEGVAPELARLKKEWKNLEPEALTFALATLRRGLHQNDGGDGVGTVFPRKPY